MVRPGEIGTLRFVLPLIVDSFVSPGGARDLRPRPVPRVREGRHGVLADPAPEEAGSRDAIPGDSGWHIRCVCRSKTSGGNCCENSGSQKRLPKNSYNCIVGLPE